jgi:Protein of unknown function (DUF421)
MADILVLVIIADAAQNGLSGRVPLSEDELRSKLREHGVTDYAQVAQAYMESDGEVSVIKR